MDFRRFSDMLFGEKEKEKEKESEKEIERLKIKEKEGASKIERAEKSKDNFIEVAPVGSKGVFEKSENGKRSEPLESENEKIKFSERDASKGGEDHAFDALKGGEDKDNKEHLKKDIPVADGEERVDIDPNNSRENIVCSQQTISVLLSLPFLHAILRFSFLGSMVSSYRS
jgi:hypothetical protein